MNGIDHCVYVLSRQQMTKPQKIEEPDGSRLVMDQVISTKLTTASTYAIPASEYCLLGCAKKRSTGVNKRQPVLYKEGLIYRDNDEVGDSVSTDQFVVPTPGSLPNGYDRERRENRFHCGTI